jgi:hypothetical protein
MGNSGHDGRGRGREFCAFDVPLVHVVAVCTPEFYSFCTTRPLSEYICLALYSVLRSITSIIHAVNPVRSLGNAQ